MEVGLRLRSSIQLPNSLFFSLKHIPLFSFHCTKKHIRAGKIFILFMLDVQFPNATLNAHWTKGNAVIAKYIFENCNIKTINSLETTAGPKQEFEFRHMAIDTIRGNAFYIEFVVGISFVNTTVVNIDLSFLSRYYGCLIHFQFDMLPAKYNLNTIFGTLQFPHLISLVISTPYSQLKTIFASNFTNLPNIQNLELNRCAIEYIDKNAFNSIALSLQTLYLRDNALHTIQPWTFDSIINRNSMKSVAIGLSGNMLDFDCKFLELFALGTMGIRHKSSVESNLFHVVCVDMSRLPRPNKCKNLHVIQPSKFSLPDLGSNIIYSKFAIHMHKDRQSLYIRTSVENRYRVWIYNFMNDTIYNLKWGYSTKKCLAKGYLETVGNCLIINGGDTSIPIERIFSRSEIKMFCISYVYGGFINKFWPLHCISIGPSYIVHQASYKPIYMLIIWAIIIFHLV